MSLFYIFSSFVFFALSSFFALKANSRYRVFLFAAVGWSFIGVAAFEQFVSGGSLLDFVFSGGAVGAFFAWLWGVMIGIGGIAAPLAAITFGGRIPKIINFYGVEAKNNNLYPVKCVVSVANIGTTKEPKFFVNLIAGIPDENRENFFSLSQEAGRNFAIRLYKDGILAYYTGTLGVPSSEPFKMTSAHAHIMPGFDSVVFPNQGDFLLGEKPPFVQHSDFGIIVDSNFDAVLQDYNREKSRISV